MLLALPPGWPATLVARAGPERRQRQDYQRAKDEDEAHQRERPNHHPGHTKEPQKERDPATPDPGSDPKSDGSGQQGHGGNETSAGSFARHHEAECNHDSEREARRNDAELQTSDAWCRAD